MDFAALDGTMSYVVNHVFLPPQLPQADDSGNYENDVKLLKLCESALKTFQRYLTSHDEQSRVRTISGFYHGLWTLKIC